MVESPVTAEIWKVEYVDGGVVVPVDRKDLSVYRLEGIEWATDQWFAAKNLVASGEVVTVNA